MAASFLVAAGVSFAVEGSNFVAPSVGVGRLRLYNTLPCNVTVSCGGDEFLMVRGGCYERSVVGVEGSRSLPYEIRGSCHNASGEFLVQEEAAVGYYFEGSEVKFYEDVREKEELGRPLVR